MLLNIFYLKTKPTRVFFIEDPFKNHMNILYFITLIFFQSHFCTTHEYILHTPYILSESAREDAFNFLKNSSSGDGKVIIANLRAQFPWIKHATCRQFPHNRSSITLQLSEPFCALNTTHYVTSDGSIFSSDILRNDIFTQLPVIILSETSECSTNLGKEIASLPRDLFNKYTITWHDKNTIILIDKNTECFPIITSLVKKITSQVAHYCHYIHKKITETYTKKKKKKYSLDVRFDKQIVLRPQEDIKYEKRFSS